MVPQAHGQVQWGLSAEEVGYLEKDVVVIGFFPEHDFSRSFLTLAF